MDHGATAGAPIAQRTNVVFVSEASRPPPSAPSHQARHSVVRVTRDLPYGAPDDSLAHA